MVTSVHANDTIRVIVLVFLIITFAGSIALYISDGAKFKKAMMMKMIFIFKIVCLCRW